MSSKIRDPALKSKTYKHFTILRPLTDSIFLTFSTTHNKFFVIKLFNPEENQRIFYLREAKMINLNHKNLISIVDAQDRAEINFEKINGSFSYILLDIAVYGNFSRILLSGDFINDDVFIRTYFQQLICGVEYLHSQGFAHMDLKIQNLLISDNTDLKIADFEFSQNIINPIDIHLGSKNYRAPEVLDRNCKDLKAADIYSVGIILYVMKTKFLPYDEEKPNKEYNMKDILYEKPELFWEVLFKMKKNISKYFDKDFKDLFLAMTKKNPSDRITIEDIKRNSWYNGRIYSRKELEIIIKYHLKVRPIINLNE